MLRNIQTKQPILGQLYRHTIPWINNVANNNNTNIGLSQAPQCNLHTSARLAESQYYINKQYPKKKHGRRDAKVRALFCEHEDERNALRSLRKSDILPHAVKSQAAEDLAALPVDSCINRVRDRCVLTDRPRSTVRKYKISRIEFRAFADDGLIPGYTRSIY